MLMLRTTGRRTGEPRVSALLYVRDGDEYVVVASAGGRDSHPGWYFNVTAGASSQIQIGRERTTVIGSVATGERRKRLWAEADRVNKGGYTQYQARTEREIPVVILSPT
jgi:deazaflavin-dependent oxidoreductase (nitroreductase family)